MEHALEESLGDAPRVYFAVVGDVHGQFVLTHRLLKGLEVSIRHKLDFVLQVGDIECHRTENDMRSMAAPASKRNLGDFHKLSPHGDDPAMDPPLEAHFGENGGLRWSWPTYFIGGNHECYGWLDRKDGDLPKEVAHNMQYLGRAGYFPIRVFRERRHFASVHIAFLSGIHRPDDFYKRRPTISDANLESKSNKSWISFNCYDVNVLIADEEDDGVEKSSESQYLQPVSSEAELSFAQILQTRIRHLLWLPTRAAAESALEVEHPEAQGDDQPSGELVERLSHNARRSEDPRLSEVDVKFLLRFVLGSGLESTALDSAYHRLANCDLQSDSGSPHRTDHDRSSTDHHHANVSDQDSSEGVEGVELSSHQSRVDGIKLSSVVSYFSAKVGGNKKREANFLKKFQCKNKVDVLLTHDWPAGLLSADMLLRGSRPMGNEICRQLRDDLKPKLHCCGHMHTSYRANVRHAMKAMAQTDTNPTTVGTGTVMCDPDRSAIHDEDKHVTQTCCVSKVSYPHAIAVYSYDIITGLMREIDPPRKTQMIESLLKAQEEEPSDLEDEL